MPSALSPATPRLTVQYGSFTIDESKGCRLSTAYDSEDNSIYGSFYCEFTLRLTSPSGVVATDDTAWQALVAAVESDVSGLRTPRQRLLVQLGGKTLRDWNFTSASQTAIMIQPELRLIEENARFARYGFRVRCQFPGNVPSNVNRRESLTRIGTSLRERRTCSITATWTSSPSTTAYARYLASGDAFYDAYLPATTTDQHGNAGTWIRSDEDPAYNDENSIITATRVYWEVFAGRRESTTMTVDKIDDRRVVTIPSIWAATPGFTALQNYQDNGGTFFAAALPANVTNGEWVLVDQEFGYNDQNGTLSAVNTYHECVLGLANYEVEITSDAANLRTAVVAGVYYATTLTALQNYNNNISTLISSVLTREAITRYESVSVPKVIRYDQTNRRLFFRWTLRELAYPQGSSVDDPNVTFELLEVRVNKPKDPQAFTPTITPNRLFTVTADFVAIIDYTQSDDPESLWESGLRDHVTTAITTKLGGDVTTVEVVDEDVGVGLHSNQLVGRLKLVVTAGASFGGILWLKITQTLLQIPSRDFADRADGTNSSVYPYRAPPETLLFRRAICEFVVGSEPALFAIGDTPVSGYGLIDTGKTAQGSIDDQNASGTLSYNAWFIDRRAGTPYAYSVEPTTRGDGFATVRAEQIESWRYVAALEPGTTL